MGGCGGEHVALRSLRAGRTLAPARHPSPFALPVRGPFGEQFATIANTSSLVSNSNGTAVNMVVDSGVSLTSNTSTSLIGRSLSAVVGGTIVAQVRARQGAVCVPFSPDLSTAFQAQSLCVWQIVVFACVPCRPRPPHPPPPHIGCWYLPRCVAVRRWGGECCHPNGLHVQPLDVRRTLRVHLKDLVCQVVLPHRRCSPRQRWCCLQLPLVLDALRCVKGPPRRGWGVAVALPSARMHSGVIPSLSGCFHSTARAGWVPHRIGGVHVGAGVLVGSSGGRRKEVLTTGECSACPSMPVVRVCVCMVCCVWRPAPSDPQPFLHVNLAFNLSGASVTDLSTLASATSFRAAVVAAVSNAGGYLTVSQLANLNVFAASTSTGLSPVTTVQFATLVADEAAVRWPPQCP
jgi:hypothetical protein